MGGEIEWRELLLRDLAAPVRNALVGGPFGSDLVSSDYSPNGVPVIRGENLSSGRWVGGDFVFVPPAKAQKLAANTAGPLDIVFTQRGANHYRQVAVVPADAPQRFVISQSQMKLTVDMQKADPLFIYYLFCAPSQQEYLQRNAIQAGVPHTNLSILKNMPLCIPSLPAQRSIARILGTLDDKIELNQRTNETLEAIARALFKSWFVDFDPVRAKAEGRDPGLPKDVADLFPDAFEDSGLGEIPRGWMIEGVYAVSDVIYGAPFSSPLFSKDHVGKPLIRIRDLATHNPDVFTSEAHPRGYLVQPGDLIVGMDGEFRAHLWSGPEAWLNQRLCCFKPKPSIPRAFVHYSIETQLNFFERSKTGTTVIHLGKSDIDTFRVLVPPKPVVTGFGNFTEPLDSRIVGIAHESRTLAALRDTLLPKLISGELRVRDAERIVEKVA
jgi:type I restriction enzyme, S subunit